MLKSLWKNNVKIVCCNFIRYVLSQVAALKGRLFGIIITVIGNTQSSSMVLVPVKESRSFWAHLKRRGMEYQIASSSMEHNSKNMLYKSEKYHYTIIVIIVIVVIAAAVLVIGNISIIKACF
jgi:hypothetical protein